MNRRVDLRAAAGILAAAAGTGLASGRELSTFFAQTGGASWLGVAAAGLVMGAFAAMTHRLRRNTGGGSFPQLFRRLLGRAAGGGIRALHALTLALAAGTMLAAAGHIGALALPLYGARFYGAAIALALAASLALGGVRALRAAGCVYLPLLLAFELALLAFGRMPAHALGRFETELQLRGSIPAALALGALNACMHASIAATPIARIPNAADAPGAVGLSVGGLYALALLLGSAALARQPEEVLGMRLPFVALASGWGKAGFYISAGLMYFGAVATLAGALFSAGCALSERRASHKTC